LPTDFINVLALYIETYNVVIKSQTIKLVICITLSNNWPLCQMDVNNVFHHGSISEDIYMPQPPSFVTSHFPDYVCKLHKVLYDLKQAPRAWYNSWKDFLNTFGFLNYGYDTFLFVYNQDGIVAYFLIYVEDLLLTGNNYWFLNALKIVLALKYSLKDLGPLIISLIWKFSLNLMVYSFHNNIIYVSYWFLPTF